MKPWKSGHKLNWGGKLGSLVIHAHDPEILGIIVDYKEDEEAMVSVKWFCDSYAGIPQDEDVFFLKVVSK